MPHVLIAGIVASKPKSDPFPTTGRLHAEVGILVDGADGTVYRIIGYGSQVVEEIEVLEPGDAVSIQGNLQLEMGPPAMAAAC
jgi:hypothetical protein